jgi:hypothetical protein
MTRPIVTAVGRALKPKGDEPRKYQLIQVDQHGARITMDRTLAPSNVTRNT